MSENKIKARIQHLHKTEAEWTKLSNFIPNAGELIIYDIDKNNLVPRFKFGNGKDTLAELPFSGTEINVDTLTISFDAGRITEY